MSLKVTRAIIDSIHDGSVKSAEWEKFPIFNFEIPKALPGVDSKLLNPKNTWANKEEFDATLKKLGEGFEKNFKKYYDKASEGLKKCAVKV